MRFTAEELERYARQIVLPEVGGIGQERLRAAHVAMVGVGGLGSPIALYLAAAGIGRLTLIDDDAVEVGNLQRQVLFDTEAVGRPKTERAAVRLAELNPDVTVDVVTERLTAANAGKLLASADLIVDGSDSFETRAEVAKTAAKLQKVLVSGSVQGTDGQLIVLTPFADPTLPCFECLFPSAPAADALPTCAQGGILGSIAGLVGCLMATEALKVLLHLEGVANDRFLLIDGLAPSIHSLAAARREVCTGPHPNPVISV